MVVQFPPPLPPPRDKLADRLNYRVSQAVSRRARGENHGPITINPTPDDYGGCVKRFRCVQIFL